MLSSPVQLWPPECPSRSLQQRKKKRQRERKTAVSLKKSYSEYHSIELNCIQAPVITWHYHRWTERRWILHSVSSISARLLLRQETWKQSLGTSLEGMSESLCHAAKCWALYCVLSVWAWNYSMRILPLFMCVHVHAFARYVVISGKICGYFCICVCLCAHEKHCVGFACGRVWVLNFVTLFTQKKAASQMQRQPTKARLLQFVYS